MSIIKYRALLKSLELNSLTQAAEQLGYTQPGISHMILSLEQEMGFPLLIRSREGIAATPELEQLLIYIHQIIDASNKLQETIDKINGIETGTIRIGSFHSISLQWMPAVIRSYSECHPQVELQLLEGDEGELAHWLIEGKIDCALMCAPAPDGFEFYPLHDDPVMAVLPSSHPLAACETVSAKELVKYPFIIPSKGADEDVLRVMNGEHLTPDIKFRIKGDETILAMVERGLGVSLMPSLLLKKIPDDIVIRPLTFPYHRNLGFALRSKKYASPATLKLLDTITEYLQPHN